mmetsp:Transcript_13242/g.2053  ORF Transcript_13242/g.2053 Transcript_13242/m.2053 type:complete len:104 (-) Transcript_13242:4885-5196(-)
MTPLIKYLNNKLIEYNIGSHGKMDLVFFEEAIFHILRISRALRQPRGSMMLIGVGGSGKQSLTKLTSSILRYQDVTIEPSKQYGVEDFRNDIKEYMKISGIEG